MRILFSALSMGLFGSMYAAEPVADQPLPPPPSISYTLPGIIWSSGGWVGSDHLLNLTENVYVVVDIIKPDNVDVSFTPQDIRAIVLKTFDRKGWDINFTSEGDGPPLPYFNVLLMIQRIEGGYAVSVQGRLFESVTLKRFILAENATFQAITWEKQNLIVTPTEQLNDQVFNGVQEITNLFLERYDFFEKQKKKLGSDVRINAPLPVNKSTAPKR